MFLLCNSISLLFYEYDIASRVLKVSYRLFYNSHNLHHVAFEIDRASDAGVKLVVMQGTALHY